MDLVKCRRQVDSKLYRGNFEAWGKIGRAEGFRGIYTGWSPTLFGYSVCLNGNRSLLERLTDCPIRPKVLSNTAVMSSSRSSTQTWPEKISLTVTRHQSTWPAVLLPSSLQTSHYVRSRPSRSACRPQSLPLRLAPSLASPPSRVRRAQPGKAFRAGPRTRAVSADGSHSLFKGLYPLWGRQIPYTMMKFASFETIVEMIYEQMPRKKSEYGRGVQTVVSFAAGYAGMRS